MAFTLRFRAFDDGIAFRYELAQPDSLAVTDELTEFRFANEGHTMSWSIPGQRIGLRQFEMCIRDRSETTRRRSFRMPS